ncbi:hypothetical protein CORC01_10966, partial [Colletotrichum orchidophilum]
QSRTPFTGRHWTRLSHSPPHPLYRRVTPPAIGYMACNTPMALLCIRQHAHHDMARQGTLF